ncbi:putative uncharacterized protein DDB_G0282133 isoform X2 [Nymphalis io]|uniref:putative uncharacterized protein DDB_G0282133 isoform X2 n=1 Tax=Inachis io TaxID=171585 RepID=UPI0021670102|nr:putative uncharacterized protein DDB_G0282133 isoform X2 [Nymphalis io]
MAFHRSANCIFFPGLLAIAVFSLPLISTENIDCKGKAFHCVNSTHFKICVDLGGGVSRTVDEFLIPCPISTACNDINKFECEYQVTTTLPSIRQNDITSVLVESGTASAWDNADVTTFVPENDKSISSATTIDTSYLFIINNTSNFIPSSTLGDTLKQGDSRSENNVKHNKTIEVSDEYRVTTALPSKQQSDVTSVRTKLGITSAWDVDVTTFAPDNNTNDSSATTIETSYLIITNDTSNFIPLTTLDDTLNQVDSSSANNVKYNKTFEVSDEYRVTTALPSKQQSDVTSVRTKLGITSAWDVDVTTFAPDNNTNDSSATTIETSYLIITNDTSNFIPLTTLDDTLNQVDSSSANNVKYNKTFEVSDEYRVMTALPSIQQSDVTSAQAKLGTTSAWDVDVATFAPDNNTNDSSATTIETSYLTNDTSNFIPSTTLDDTFNQVDSSSVNNVEYNKTSYVSDSATVTNIDDVSTVNAKVTLNDIILNSTLNKSVLLISGELSLPKTIQGETEINIDVLELNNTSLYVNNNEKEIADDVGTLSSPLGKIIENPIIYSTETTSFLSDYNTSTTPVSVSSNLNISNVVNDTSTNLLKPTITTDTTDTTDTDTTLYTVDIEHPINSKGEQILTTLISYKPLTTVASEPFTNMKLNVRNTISYNDGKKDDTMHVISQIYSSPENMSRKASTNNVVNGWKGFSRNIDEQNKLNKTETLFTLVSSNTELPSTKSVESSTSPYTYDNINNDLTKNDWQNSENAVTSSIYTTDLYSVSEFQNHSANMHVLPTSDDQTIKNKYDVIDVLNVTESHLVTPVANIITEVLHNAPIAINESLTQYILESNTLSDIEISKITEADIKASNLKVINNDSNFSMFTDISPTKDLIDMSFKNLPDINVTNNTMYNDVNVSLTPDDKLPIIINNTNAGHVSNANFINNDTFVVENTSTVTSFITDPTLTVSDTAFTLVTNTPLIQTNQLNINFSSTSKITSQYTSNPEYFQPTTTAYPNVYFTKITNMEKPPSSDVNLDINNRIITDNKTITIEDFGKDSRDYLTSNLSLSRMHDNISSSLLDTTTVNPNQDIEAHVNERLNSFTTNAEKTYILISSPNTTYSQLNLRSSELTTSTDTISVHPFEIQFNNLNNSFVNESNLGVPDVPNNNDIINTINEQVQSSVDQTVVENSLNITQKKEEYKTFNLPLSDANFTLNNNLINIDEVIETTLPIQKLILLAIHENKTDDVNTKTSELISTTKAVTITDSSNLFLTSYEDLRETYDSVTPHVLDTTNPYIYKKDLPIAEPSINTTDQQNYINSKIFVNIENVDSGLLSTPHNTWENMSNIQDLKVSNNDAVVISDAIIRSSPILMKINSSHFSNSSSVNTTLNSPSNPINIVQTKSRVVMPHKNDTGNSSSTASNVNKDGMPNNVTLTHSTDKIKSVLISTEISSNSKNLSVSETEPTSNFELSQNSNQLNNDSTLQYNKNKNNVNIVTILGKTNNNTRLLKLNENEINETLNVLQEDSNLHTATTPNLVGTTPTPKSVVKCLTVNLTNYDLHLGNQTPPSEQFTCIDRNRGKYSDKSNCNKFYICIGRPQPIIGMCPEDTVFSEIRKQCTNNLSHCIRNNQFRCLSSGRFLDILSEQFYYICVKKLDGYVRFKLQCQKGYHLNKEKIQCLADTSIENSSNSTSDKSTNEMKSEDTSYSVNYEIRFECEKEGKFEHPDDCRKYFVCRKNSKSKFRRKIKKCSSDEVFNKEKRKCVDADSYEC